MIKPGKRVTLFCGHYGSGKTNVAVNYAVFLKNAGLDVGIADVDIVNPYFRTKDSEEELKSLGIEVISLPFANSNVDLPSLPSEVYSLVQRRDVYAVMDIGGDDRGAYALGRFTPYILEENNYDMLFVANFCRPLTQTVSDTVEVMREIELACGIRITGIVNNTNLGEETTPETVYAGIEKAEELSKETGLPVVMTTVSDKVDADCENILRLKLQKKII